MELQIRKKGAITLATKRGGGGHTRVGRPVTWRTGAPESALRMATIKAQTARLASGVLRKKSTGLPNPIAFFSDRETIKPDPQAHKPADSDADVGSGARMCRLYKCLEMSIKHGCLKAKNRSFRQLLGCTQYCVELPKAAIF